MTKAKKPAADRNSTPGLAARLAATNMLALVVDDKASLETVTDHRRGLKQFLALDSRDRSLARAITLAALRNRTRILAALSKCWNRKPPARARFLLFSLETAAAQLLFMDVPPSAAVNLAVTAIRKDHRTTRFSGFANAVLRNLIRDREHLLAEISNTTIFPEWMQKQLASDFGRQKTAAMSNAFHDEPAIDLTFSTPCDGFDNLSVALPGNSRRLTVSQPIDTLPGYTAGGWWVQDIAAAQPVRLLGDVAGKHIADLCAAPGGKTLQLATSGAHVTAIDISANRILRLKENLARTGQSAEVVETDILDYEPGPVFDGVLLDAPCTATGTIRRHPDILWNCDRGKIDTLVDLQTRLIRHAAGFLKPGGILVYANCSLFKAEGENLLAGLASESLVTDPIQRSDLDGMDHCITGQGIFRALPHYSPGNLETVSGMDGFFAARFVRKG